MYHRHNDTILNTALKPPRKQRQDKNNQSNAKDIVTKREQQPLRKIAGSYQAPRPNSNQKREFFVSPQVDQDVCLAFL